MAVEAIVKPYYSDVQPEPELIHFGEIFFSHDQIIGKLILAKNLAADIGANIYVIDNFSKEPGAVDPAMLFGLANANNLHSRILPYLRTEFPTHLDNGEPATLNLRHYPSYVAIFGQRPDLV